MVQNSFSFFSESLIPLLLKCCSSKKASPPQTFHPSDYHNFSFYCLTIVISLIITGKGCLTEITLGGNNFLWIVFIVVSVYGCVTPRAIAIKNVEMHGEQFLPQSEAETQAETAQGSTICHGASVPASLPPSNTMTFWIYLISLCNWPQTCDLIIFSNTVIYLSRSALS